MILKLIFDTIAFVTIAINLALSIPVPEAQEKVGIRQMTCLFLKYERPHKTFPSSRSRLLYDIGDYFLSVLYKEMRTVVKFYCSVTGSALKPCFGCDTLTLSPPVGCRLPVHDLARSKPLLNTFCKDGILTRQWLKG